MIRCHASPGRRLQKSSWRVAQEIGRKVGQRRTGTSQRVAGEQTERSEHLSRNFLQTVLAVSLRRAIEYSRSSFYRFSFSGYVFNSLSNCTFYTFIGILSEFQHYNKVTNMKFYNLHNMSDGVLKLGSFLWTLAVFTLTIPSSASFYTFSSHAISFHSAHQGQMIETDQHYKLFWNKVFASTLIYRGTLFYERKSWTDFSARYFQKFTTQLQFIKSCKKLLKFVKKFFESLIWLTQKCLQEWSRSWSNKSIVLMATLNATMLRVSESESTNCFLKAKNSPGKFWKQKMKKEFWANTARFSRIFDT